MIRATSNTPIGTVVRYEGNYRNIRTLIEGPIIHYDNGCLVLIVQKQIGNFWELGDTASGSPTHFIIVSSIPLEEQINNIEL